MSMYSKALAGTALAAVIVASAGTAAAAPIPLLRTDVTVTVSDSDPFFFNDPFFGLNFTSVGTGTSTGAVEANGLSTQISAIFGTEGSASSASLAISEADLSPFLSGTLDEAGFVIVPGDGDRIELSFAVTSGDAAFGDLVLATITGDFGDSVDDLFATGFSAPASLELQPATVVPAPVPLALLATAIACLAARRYQQS